MEIYELGLKPDDAKKFLDISLRIITLCVDGMFRKLELILAVDAESSGCVCQSTTCKKYDFFQNIFWSSSE